MVEFKPYYDENRLLHETDRRFHAADAERAGRTILTVPAVVRNMAPLVTPGAWGRNEQLLQQREAEARNEASYWDAERAAWQRWWNRQWRKEHGLYRVQTLTKGQKEFAQRLLDKGGFPEEAFPQAEGPIRGHNDAQILAEVAACGGTMLITSDTRMVDEVEMRRWQRSEGAQWGLDVVRLIYNVDDLYIGWASNPEAGNTFLEVAIGAYWPASPSAGINLVRDSVEEGIDALTRGHLPRMGAHIRHQLEVQRDLPRIVERVRGRLPQGTREAEDTRKKMIRAATRPEANAGPEVRDTRNERGTGRGK